MQPIVVKRAKFGNTTYYLATMKAMDVVNYVRIPRDVDGWENLTPEERYQREINYKRVKDHIAPYLAKNDDRFFGAFIVSIMGPPADFESLDQVLGKDLPKMYRNLFEEIGVLHCSKGQVLTPLDGQHRLCALEFAILGKDEKKQDINTFAVNPAVRQDDVALILIQHDRVKARKIFNKVNQYAKPAAKGDNLITDDDNVAALIARELVKNLLPEPHLVLLTTNTISRSQGAFTTLPTVYESTLTFLESVCNNGAKLNLLELPDQTKVDLYWGESSSLWQQMLSDFGPWADALADRSPNATKQRSDLREDYPCLKPVIQRAIIEAVAEFIHDGKGNVAKAISHLNRIDWSTKNSIWQHVFFGQRGTIISGPTDRNFATKFIAYLIGAEVDENKLLAEWKERVPDPKGLKLPQRA